MIALSYLACLLGAIACMALLDHRFRLVLWRDRRRGIRVLAVGLAVFVLWDVLAIALGFYQRGDSAAMTGIMLGPHFPLEEVFFIIFLCYLALILHGLVGLLLSRAAGRGRVASTGTDREENR